MKKLLALGLAGLVAIGGTSAVLANNYRDKAEGPEANPTHMEGAENKYEDGKEGLEKNLPYVEGSEGGEESEAGQYLTS